MNFLIRRFWRVSLIAVLLCLSQSDSLLASDDSYLCLDANLGETELAKVLQCNSAPVITCPPMYFDCPGTSIHPSETGYATAIPGQGDCPDAIITYSDEVVVNESCRYEVHRTWSADYPVGINEWLFSECTQIIMLIDDAQPLIKNCPSDITVFMNSDCVGVATWSQPVYTDNCGISSRVSSHDSGDTFPEGVTTVTYTVYDNCGNSNSCSFDVTVEGACCVDPPAINCPSNVTGCAGSGPADYHPSVTGYATAVPGTGCSDPIITWSDATAPIQGCTNGSLITRTWTAKDPSDPTLSSTCVQTIWLGDTVRPMVNGCPKNFEVHTEDASGAIVNWVDPVFSDNCGIQTVNPSHTNGSLFPVGNTPVTISGIDNCGNFTSCSFVVFVILDACEVAPIISCPSNKRICAGGGAEAYHPDRMGYATAIKGGQYCGDPIVTWSDDFVGLPNCPNGMMVKRTWTAKDPENVALQNTCIQIIEVGDDSAPVVSCVSDINMEADNNVGSSVTFTAPAFTDSNCGIENISGSHNSGDMFPIGTTTITYTGTNYCGNNVTCSFNINVAPPSCDTPPVITCPADLTLCVEASITPTATGYATASSGSGSNCDAPIISYTDYVQPTAKCDGAQVITRTWTAKDPNNSNLFATCDQKITKQDHVDPIISGCPDNISVISGGSGCDAVVTWTPPTATDNCGIDHILSSHTPGSTFSEGTTTVTYTAYDNCGNSSSCSFTINVACNNIPCSAIPVISCPANYTGCIGESTSPAVLGYATAAPGLGSCDAPVVSYTDQVVSTGPCAGEQVINRTWKATDPHGSNIFVTCVQIITLTDPTPPSIVSCPSDIVLTGDVNCQAVATWTTPTATDNCSAVNVSSTHTSGSAFACGSTTVTYTFVDSCGNVTSCSFNVVVVNSNIGCAVAPIINCPADWFACPGTPTHPSTTGFGSASPGLGSCDMPITSYSDQVISTDPCDGAITIHRTWVAFDPNDASVKTTCIQTISLGDNSAPSVSACPANITVDGDANCQAIVTWTAPIATDNCGVANISSSHEPGSVFTEGNTTVTYTITDNCGNVANCSFNVSVICAPSCTAPIIDCPNYYAGCPGTSIDPSVTGYATAVPGAAGCANPTITYTDQLISTGSCDGADYIFRTWTATDPSDATLFSSCVQAINITDNVDPTISNVPSDINVTGNANCEAVVTWNPPAATDFCGTPTSSSTHNPGSVFGVGTTAVTYTFTDGCGNTSSVSFNVTVTCAAPICNSIPVITCPSNWSACAGSSSHPSTTGYATAVAGSSTCDTPIVTYSDQVLSTGPCAGATTIYRTWIAKDPNNATLSVSCIQAITLEDSSLPTITSCPDNISVLAGSSCAAPVNWVAPVATDNCGIASINSNFAPGSVFNTGTTTVTYTITDNCGNVASCSFTVTVSCSNQGCSQPPVINCPTNYSACAGGSSHPSVTGYASATAGLASCDAPLVTYTDHIVSTGPCNGAKVINRTWIATDPNNSSITASCVQVITLEDNTIPTITSCPDNISVLAGASCTAAVNWIAPVATDNCGVASVTSNYAPGSVFNTGTTTVTYTITDNCGNVASCSFTVTISCSNQGCSLPPVINCPANYSACAGGSTHPSVTGYASATAGLASCDAPLVTYTDHIVSTGPCAGAQVINRTWIATDPNNSSITTTCVQTISVGDSQAPSFVYCPADITLDGGPWCDAVATWGTVTATDNCGAPILTSTHQVGELLDEGVTTVTYTATDACGNVAHCSFNITVTCSNVCNQPPVINCPANVSLCPWSPMTPSLTGYATATGAAHCGNPSVTYNDIIVSEGTCGDKVVHRVWTATEPMNTSLTSSCTQIITLSDNNAPGIWDCPADITVANGSPATWVAPTADDNCELLSFTSTHNSGTVFPAGTTTVTYTAVDQCGNTSHCTFNVTVAGPTGNLHCNDDIVVSCGSNGGAYVTWDEPTYSGTCTSSCNSGGYIPGFIYMGTFGGSQYYCSVNPATWPIAEATCLANGGHLASVNNAQENHFLAGILTNQTAWIGLNDESNEGTFTWSNGDPVSYTNWYADQPNNYNNQQDYVEMLSDGQWNDQYNYKALEYIMEIPCSPVTQTGGQTSGSYFTVGTHTITYALDSSCGGATCSFTVTVEASLTIDCTEDITEVPAAGQSGVHVSWPQPSANSCCTNCTGGGYIPGFIYMGSFNGHYYYCSVQPSTWQNASASCSAYGGYLASVGSAHENQFLANILTTQSAWIGLNDAANEGTFTWTNGDPVTYTNWYAQQPNNYDDNQDYCEMLNNGQWNDQYNDSVLEYIMEIPGCVTVTQTEGPASGSYFAAGSTTQITYKATDGCGNVEYCTFNVNVPDNECNSGGVNSNPVHIAAVGFGDLHNTSGNDGGYADYTNHCANVQAGGSYPINLTAGFGGAAQKCFWKVWIDFNMDGDFFDDGEYIAYGLGNSTISGTIAIPWANIWNGTTTMRVACKFGSYPTGPCEVFQTGETEDYCINITGADFKPEDGSVENRSLDLYEAVGLTEAAKSKTYDLSIFPNPTTDFIIIEHEDTDQVESVEIYNSIGQLVKGGIGAEEHKINLQGLENGVYILSTRYIDGNVNTSRFVIQQ